MMRKMVVGFTFPMVIILAACSNPADQREVACLGGTLAGAVVGGAIGNQFGGGRGNAILTGAGALGGGAAAATSMDCVR